MLSINNFIVEKLKVNSKTKINNSLIDEIIETWGVKYYKDFHKKYYHDLCKILEVWIKGCDVKKVKFYAPTWAIHKIEEHGIPKTIKYEYVPLNANNEYIYDYLKNNPNILINANDIFTDKDGNKHDICVVEDGEHIISFNVEDCGTRICHKEN